MFTCRECIDLLLDYLDGDLSAEQRAHLDAHLNACPPCVEFVKTYRATTSLCKEALKRSMPVEVANRLSTFLRENLHPAHAKADAAGKPKG
jgi:anti-sigma factor RsiW